MKYLVLFAVLAVAYMFWRNNRVKDIRKQAPPSDAGKPQDMVCCPVCSVHLPRGDALTGPDGKFYCSNEHRLRAGS